MKEDLKTPPHGFSSERTHLCLVRRILPENDGFQEIFGILWTRFLQLRLARKRFFPEICQCKARIGFSSDLCLFKPGEFDWTGGVETERFLFQIETLLPVIISGMLIRIEKFIFHYWESSPRVRLNRIRFLSCSGMWMEEESILGKLVKLKRFLSWKLRKHCC